MSHAGTGRVVRNPYEEQHYQECAASSDFDGPAGDCTCEQLTQFFEDMCAEWAYDAWKEEGMQ